MHSTLILLHLLETHYFVWYPCTLNYFDSSSCSPFWRLVSSHHRYLHSRLHSPLSLAMWVSSSLWLDLPCRLGNSNTTVALQLRHSHRFSKLLSKVNLAELKIVAAWLISCSSGDDDYYYCDCYLLLQFMILE